MAPSIHTLHWSPVPQQVVANWAPPKGMGLAIWPSPIDFDHCLAEAGFKGFADTDDAWDEEFVRMVQVLVEACFALGEPIWRSRQMRPTAAWIQWKWRKLFKRATHVAEIVQELLSTAVLWDNPPPTIVAFGQPPHAVVGTSAGHPVLWLWVSDAVGDPARFVSAVAAGRPQVQTTLDWTHIGLM